MLWTRECAPRSNTGSLSPAAKFRPSTSRRRRAAARDLRVGALFYVLLTAPRFMGYELNLHIVARPISEVLPCGDLADAAGSGALLTLALVPTASATLTRLTSP